MKINDFNFDLPNELIADTPANPRDSSRLLYFDENNKVNERIFSEIDEFFDEGDVIIFNDSKVVPSYLIGKIGEKKFQFNLIRYDFQQGETQNLDILGRPRKVACKGAVIEINKELKFIINKVNEDGVITIEFIGSSEVLLNKLNNYGLTPIPLYILKKRGLKEEDKHNYQTIYAKNEGSVAAPTAGLHFTPSLMERLQNRGVKLSYVTLNVGAGTFLPVKTESIKDHKMHSELINVSRETSEVINKAKGAGKKIICVGTTSLRALESCADTDGILTPQTKYTDIFIYPGYKFKIVDKLITNFHLPKSTLLMLISAFSGLENIKNLYEHAIKNKVRFYSYGDACLLKKL